LPENRGTALLKHGADVTCCCLVSVADGGAEQVRFNALRYELKAGYDENLYDFAPQLRETRNRAVKRGQVGLVVLQGLAEDAEGWEMDVKRLFNLSGCDLPGDTGLQIVG